MRTKEDIQAYVADNITPHINKLTSEERNCMRLCMCVLLQVPLTELPVPLTELPDEPDDRKAYWATWCDYLEKKGLWLLAPNSNTDSCKEPRGLFIAVTECPYTEGGEVEHAVLILDSSTVYDSADNLPRVKEKVPVRYWVVVYPLDIGKGE